MRKVKVRIWICVGLLTLLGCACRNEQERVAEQVRRASISEFGLAPTTQAGPKKPSDWLSWNERILVGGYEAVGDRNPRWDSSVREALRLFAQDNAGLRSPTQNLRLALSNQVQQAIAAGCQDPSILYLQGRFVIPNVEERQTESAMTFLRAAEGLRAG